MSKISKYAITYEDCKSIEIKLLKVSKMLLANQYIKSTIRWHINNETTGRIEIIVNTTTERPFIELKYRLNQEDIQYKVPLIVENSNLGKGKVWFFLCPFTLKKCRKLYLIEKYFTHRKIKKSIYYENQLLSKSQRKYIGLFNNLNEIEKAIEESESKYFKKYYNNVKTKRFQKLTKIRNRKIDINDLRLL